MNFELSKENIILYAEKYDDKFHGTSDDIVEKELRSWFSEHRYLDREHFIKLGLWKSRRPRRRYESSINTDERVQLITTQAIQSNDEYFKIKVLQILCGVSWPVASVILHFAHLGKYMIMDFRAIWSLGWQQPKSYTFDFWKRYTDSVLAIAEKYGAELRTLDKALWFYSKENERTPDGCRSA